MPGRDELSGTVKLYHRHFFLSYKDPQRWPPQLETSENDILPRSLSVSLIKSRIASSSDPSSSASPKEVSSSAWILFFYLSSSFSENRSSILLFICLSLGSMIPCFDESHLKLN